MKLWVDDLREPPDDTWSWAKNSVEAIQFLRAEKVIEMSLDHDLGGEDTTRRVVEWLCVMREVYEENFWPETIHVHSANPVGKTWLEGTINRYQPCS